MADEQKRKALESAQEFVKYLVVLAVGALAFGLALLQPTPRNSIASLTLTVLSAVLLAISVFLGILAYGTLVSQLYNDEIDLESKALLWQSQGQWVLFFAGIVLLGVGLFLRDVLR